MSLLQYTLKFDNGAYVDASDDDEMSVNNDDEESDADEDEISVTTDEEASDVDDPLQQPNSSDVQAPAKTPPKKFGKSQNRDSITWFTCTKEYTTHIFRLDALA